MTLYVYVDKIGGLDYVCVSQHNPETATVDELDSNSFTVKIPNYTPATTMANIVRNVLLAGGAEVVLAVYD